MVYKSTKVDGVYDKDPAKHGDAVKLDTITLQQAIENPAIKVMDKAALGLAAEQGMKITIFNLDTPDNFAKLVAGEAIGTVIAS
jgi:uridylate kinase